ncbi:hypothetical protein MBLNU13_g04092t1 [Cladosporium sp. NU13]
MTEQPRSSSAVRNLRSLFENKANADNDDLNSPRGRSPSSRLAVSDLNGRPLSKIRSSFIDVEHPTMDSPLPAGHPVASTKRASAFEVRTESFSTNNLDKDTVSALKKEVTDEQVRRQSNPDLFPVDEGAMESTVNTPAVEPREDQAMGVIDHAAARLTAMELPTPTEEPEEEEKHTEAKPSGQQNGADENEPPANPDKPVTGAEEEKGSLKPAEAVIEDAVSGGQGLPPVAEDLKPQNKAIESTPPKKEQAPTTATPKAVSDVKSSPSKRPGMSPRNSHRPDPVTTGSPSKAAEKNLKSPISERKSSSSTGRSPLSPTSASKPSVVRKSSRSSLTAPTAASANRERRTSSTVKSTAPAAKRETTKPANIPSHLTAPTAASRARQEAESNKPAAGRPSGASRVIPKQQISTSKPAARASTTTRPESRTSQPAAKKSTTTAAPSESFLERMMRPTAASASKTHEKPSETKALPQRTKSSAKSASAPKTNGTAKPAAKAGSASKPLHPTKAAEEKPVEQPAEQPTPAVAEIEKPVQQEPEAATYTEKKIEESAPVNGQAEKTEIPDIPIPAIENGSATPQHTTADNSEPTTAALESTPAFGQDEIR